MLYSSTINSLVKTIQRNKAVRLSYYPVKISIETGNICNLRCPLCPTNSEEGKGVAKGMLTLADFKVIFRKIKPFVTTIDLFNWGEPFLNKEIGPIIKHIKDEKPGVRIFIDTNFNIVSDEQIDQIVRYGLDRLHVSCDGATQQVYEAYRVGGSLSKVVNNLKALIIKKKLLQSDKPKVAWKYLVFRHNQHEIKQARNMAERLGIEFSVSGMRIHCAKEIFESVAVSVERDRAWIPDDPDYNYYQDMSRERDFCPKPWKTMAINWNGDVVPCGAVYDCAQYRFGNLLQDDFHSVWNSPQYREARGIILGRQTGGNVICAICKKNGYQYF